MSYREVFSTPDVIKIGGAENGVFFDVAYSQIWQGPSDNVWDAGSTMFIHLTHGDTTSEYSSYGELHLRFDTTGMDPSAEILRAQLDGYVNTIIGSSNGAVIGVYTADVTDPTVMTVGDWKDTNGQNPVTRVPEGYLDFSVVTPPGAVSFDLLGGAVNPGGYTSLVIGWYVEPTVWDSGIQQSVQFQTDQFSLTVVEKQFLPSAALV